MELILIIGFVVVGLLLGKLLQYIKNIDRNLRIIVSNQIVFGNLATFEKREGLLKKMEKGEQKYVNLMNWLDRVDEEAQSVHNEP